MRVDEAGRDAQPDGIDHTARLRVRQIANLRYRLALNADIRAVGGSAGAVDYTSAQNDNIKSGFRHCALPLAESHINRAQYNTAHDCKQGCGRVDTS